MIFTKNTNDSTTHTCGAVIESFTTRRDLPALLPGRRRNGILLKDGGHSVIYLGVLLLGG